MSAAASRRNVDASLDSFTREKSSRNEEIVSRNIFSTTQKISTKTGGSKRKIQTDPGTRGQTGPRIPGARINFINDKIIIRRMATNFFLIRGGE